MLVPLISLLFCFRKIRQIVSNDQINIQCTSFIGSIRLVDGSCSARGRLEIYYGGKWGTVCDDSFDSNNAMVACRQLGYRLNKYTY